MVQYIEAFFLYISIGSHLFPLILFLIFYSRNRKKVIKVVLFYCLYALINDLFLIDLFNLKTGKRVAFTLYSLFTVVEYVLFSVSLYLILKKRSFKKIIAFALPVFIVICTYQFYLDIYKSPIDSISITVEYIFLIAFCLFYFFEELNEPNTTFIYSSYKFWIILGILIYSTGTFFFFMQSSQFSAEQYAKWLVINYVFNVIKNVFFGIAIIIKKDNPSDSFLVNPYDELFDKPITPL